MREESNIKNRLGERKIMNCGEECEIVEYRKYNDITVKFLNSGEIVKTSYSNFKNKTIKSHFTPTVCNVGVVGTENTMGKNSKILKSYRYWHSMLNRCYSDELKEKEPTYIGCKVCDEWLHYPNFKEWFDRNYYEIEGQKMCLDKDILVKGNKIYSPETCIIVPQSINSLFTNRKLNRGNYPIGVNWKEDNKKYQAYCNMFYEDIKKHKQKYLGLYNTPEEAFQVYKEFKEKYIKQVADYYKDQIPERLYEAMYKYEVDIDD